MPGGKRRAVFEDRLEREVLPAFGGRVLAFDLAASGTYAPLMARARSAGQPIDTVDGYIAANAATRNLAVVTRDTRPFEAAGLRTVNPWTAAP